MKDGNWFWRQRWFLVACGFLLVNTYGVLRMRPPAAENPETVPAVHIEAGIGGQVADDAPLVWRFDTDMVGADEIGEYRTEGLFTLAPPVDGRWIWNDVRTLRFSPNDTWRPGNAYRVVQVRPVVDVAGRAVPLPPPPEIRTAAFQVVSVTQVNRETDGAAVLCAEFNDRPDASLLPRHLAVRDDGDRVLDYSLVGEASSSKVFFRLKQPVLGMVHVQIREGLRGESGTEGLARDVNLPVPVTALMTLQQVHPESRAYRAGRIWLRFSLRPDDSRLADFISISPPVDILVDPNGSGAALTGEFEAGQTYNLALRAGLPSVAGARLAEDQQRIVRFPNRPSAAEIVGHGHYLSAAGSRQIDIKSTNIGRMELAAERIYPNNLVQFAMRREGNYRHWYRAQRAEDGISRLTGKVALAGGGSNNRVVTNRVELTPLLGGHTAGAYALTLRADNRVLDRQLAVISDIGIAAKYSPNDLLIWANSLQTLRPVSGATVRVYSKSNQVLGQGTTDVDGLYELPSSPDKAPFLVTIEADDDINYLCLEGATVPVPGDTGGRAYLARGYEACVFTDRGIYRPGETSHVHAVVRDRNLRAPDPFPVELEAVQPDGRVFRRATVTLGELGTAEFAVDWPDYAPTGRYTMRLHIPGVDAPLGQTQVAVEEFVPPTIAVDLKTADDRVPAGGEVSFAVSARHLFGAPADGQPVVGRIIARPVAFDPPGWDGYRFGDNERSFYQQTVTVGSQKLDSEGRAEYRWTSQADWRPPAAVSLLLVGTVTGAGGRTVSAFGSRQVDPYPHYIGIRLPDNQPIWPLLEAIPVDLATVAPDGRAIQPAGPLKLTLNRVQWVTAMRENNGRWQYESARRLTMVHEQEIGVREGLASPTITLDQPGLYLLTVTDPATEASTSTLLNGYGGRAYANAWSMENPDQVELKFDRDTYRPGDTARLSIRAPFTGMALLTIEADRVLEHRVLELTTNTHQLDIPVSADYLPNVYCTLTLLRPVVAEEIWSPHRAVGVVPLRVRDRAQELAVTLQAPPTIRPQSRLHINIAVSDSHGQAAPAQVVVAAVDEGICRLTDFQTPDLLGYFRAQRRLGVSLSDLYGLLMPELPERVDGTPSAPGGDMMGMMRGRMNPIRARRFTPTALWSGPVQAGADGAASIEFDVPEFTGELRLMAVGIGSTALGRATAAVTVKRPLVVQSSLPRFLAPGDHCTMPVRVFNETGNAAEVRIEITCEGPLAVSSPDPTTLAVAAGKNQSIDFALRAAPEAGVAKVHLAVAGDGEPYRETFELAVRPPAPADTRVVSGRIEAGETVRLAQTNACLAGTGRREIWCGGSPTLKLAGGLDYLLHYPYGCVEQTTSSAFPLLYLADLAQWLQPGSIARDDTAGFVNHALLRLWSMQHRDGSFGYWNYGSETYPWGSVYATHFLVEAHRTGYEVDSDRLTAALEYVAGILRRPSPEMDEQAWGPWQTDRNLRAYACHVLTLAGHPQPSWTGRLLEDAYRLSIGARCHLAAALALSGHRADAGELLGQLGPSTASPPREGSNPTHESATRDIALRLASWLLVDPRHPEVASLARRLEGMGEGGHWFTTQDNALALLALGQYGRYLQAGQTDFSAVAQWAGGTESQVFDHTTPLILSPAAGDSVEITNQGPGPVFYYQRTVGVPADGIIAETDQGLTVRRTLRSRDGTPLATHRVDQGELVIVELMVTGNAQSTFEDVVIQDLLPAGLEIENAGLKTSEQLPWIKASPLLPVRHADARDDRMLLFTGRFTKAGHYFYAARAVTPGTYVLPPVTAEAMYEPGIRSVHGRGTLEVTR